MNSTTKCGKPRHSGPIKRICFVDDDPDTRRQWLEWAAGSGYSAQACESAFEANRVAADCFVFDVSAVCNFSYTESAYSPICRLMADHPGAEIIIGSCMSRNAVMDVIDDVENACGRRPLFYSSVEGHQGLERVLRQAAHVEEPAPHED